MTIEKMREYKKNHGYTYEQIAKLSGLPVGTVQKVFLGITKEPRYETMQALEELFHEDIVREEANYILEQQNKLSIEDYLALPEDERVELIDGVIYDMGSPTVKHQTIIAEIHARLREHIRKNKGECVALFSPLDVQVDCSDYTVVQPDIMVVCDRSKLVNGRIWGAPDLVVEVLSTSTRRKDMFLKGNKYFEAGVREYWIVDPKNEKIIVNIFEEDAITYFYNFEDMIPVSIWNGACEINFADIKDYISFLD